MLRSLLGLLLMRILFVSSGLGFGGAETQLIAIIRELSRRGNDVALFLLTSKVPRLSELSDLNLTVRVGKKVSKFSFSALRNLRAFIGEWRPDVVHGFLFDANVYSRLAAIGLGVPVFSSERSSNYKLRASQWIAHFPTRRFAAGVIANSYAGAEHARKMFSFPSDRIHVVWNGVDISRLRASARVSGRIGIREEFFDSNELLIATFVGAIKYQKDYLLALEVAGELLALDPRWRVLFVGASLSADVGYANADSLRSDGYEAEVMAKFQGMAFRNRALFVGQRGDVPRIVCESDVFFTTSILEGFPNVVLEAMVLDVPVVATDFSDIRRILPFEWQVVGSRKPKDLALAIEKAAQSRGQVVAAQRQWVEANCSISKSVDALVNVYSVCSKR